MQEKLPACLPLHSHTPQAPSHAPTPLIYLQHHQGEGMLPEHTRLEVAGAAAELVSALLRGGNALGGQQGRACAHLHSSAASGRGLMPDPLVTHTAQILLAFTHPVPVEQGRMGAAVGPH